MGPQPSHAHFMVGNSAPRDYVRMRQRSHLLRHFALYWILIFALDLLVFPFNYVHILTLEVATK